MGAANDLADEAEARIGAILLGKWRIERVIGVGGMAAVYEAHHRNQSRVAVKILHRRVGLSNTQLARFQREGYAANRVGHPGVVEVYDDNIDEHGSAFLVMELLSGQTVAELARASGGALPPAEVLHLADRLLDVLVAAHAKEILHRDIKPENLFVTTSGDLKVLDFGIARFADATLGWSSTVDGTLLGTPAFSPPEQARGRIDEMDERSDLWAVGATLFTLLTGRFVHEAETPNEQLGLAMTAAAPSLGAVAPGLPTALVVLVDRALAYERSDRWPSARTMQEAVQWVRQAWPELGAEPSRVPLEWATALERARGAATFDDGASGDPLPVSGRSRRRRRIGTAAAFVALVLVGLTARRWLPLAEGKGAQMARGGPPAVAEVRGMTPELPDRVAVAEPARAEPARITDGSMGPAARGAPSVRRPAPGARRTDVSPVPSSIPTTTASPESSDPGKARSPFDRRH